MLKHREPIIKKHRHHWRWSGRRADMIEFRCNRKGCEATKPERKMTPYELRRFKLKDIRDKERTAQMHGAGWDFQRTFHKFKKEKVAPDLYKRYPRLFKSGYKDVRDGWKWTCWELMKRVEKWAKKYPDDVTICRIDDSYHAGSYLVFILHRIKRRLWGTTVVVIPQCDGQPPCEYFMYPSHREGIQQALEKMSKFKPFRYD